ncbi:unnamed protein product [Agarophyton chilense]
MASPGPLHPRFPRTSASGQQLPLHLSVDKRPPSASGARGRARALFKPLLQYRRSKKTRALLTLVSLALLISALVFFLFGFLFPASVAPLKHAIHSDLSHLSGPSPPLNHSQAAEHAVQHADNSADLSAQPIADHPATLPEHPVVQPVQKQGASAANDQDNILVHAVQPVRADVSTFANHREKYDQASVSIVVLFHNEYESMKTSLDSWLQNGLIDYTQEILFFLNGVESDEQFLKQIPQYEQVPNDKRKIHVSAENLPLGKAITKMVQLASSEYVLLLEKDWKLIEPPHITKSRLLDSKVLIASGVAHLGGVHS